VERQDLQLDGEIHLANLDMRRYLQHHRGEIQDALHATCDKTVADRLRGGGRSGDHADGDLPFGAHLGDFVEM
jgi:hypothetical protein